MFTVMNMDTTKTLSNSFLENWVNFEESLDIRNMANAKIILKSKHRFQSNL